MAVVTRRQQPHSTLTGRLWGWRTTDSYLEPLARCYITARRNSRPVRHCVEEKWFSSRRGGALTMQIERSLYEISAEIVSRGEKWIDENFVRSNFNRNEFVELACWFEWLGNFDEILYNLMNRVCKLYLSLSLSIVVSSDEKCCSHKRRRILKIEDSWRSKGVDDSIIWILQDFAWFNYLFASMETITSRRFSIAFSLYFFFLVKCIFGERTDDVYRKDMGKSKLADEQFPDEIRGEVSRSTVPDDL